MFWVDKIVSDIKKELAGTVESGKTLVVRDEKTASGRVHVGSMRGVAIHSIVSTALNKAGAKSKFLFEINDFDPMDGMPVYLDEKVYKEHMGKPLCNVPSPDGKAKNFAEYFAEEFIDVIKKSGFVVDEFPRISEIYLSGKMNEAIELALNNADKIRDIYKRVSKSEKDADWLPLNVICEKCGKVGTTKVHSFDGKLVKYSCIKNMVEWAEGCGHEGEVSPYDGNATLPWKVEWAAKFKVYDVKIEGAGKDHSTKGGSRDVARQISEQVFEYKNPFDIPYEFFLIGGKKMSSSKGSGSSSKEIADLVPPHIFRLALLGKQPKRTVEFTPDGDTIPLLFDRYDTIAEKYFGDVDDDDAKLFETLHFGEKIVNRFLPRFSQVAFISQIPSVDIKKHVEEMKGDELTIDDLDELEMRVSYAENWIKEFTPENYIFEIQKEAPKETKNFSEIQKSALKKVYEFIEANEKLDGQILHTTLHDIRKEVDIEAKEYFSAIYISILGKESGPKAGWFLSVLDREFLLERFKEVSE
jgi:lysyl-tRNA synthetase class 1